MLLKMNPLYVCVVFISLLHQCLTDHSYPLNGRDALKVRFNEFKDVPRTRAEAEAQNFTKVSECLTNHYRGIQYMKDGDVTVIPLYDINGYIAGLQTGLPVGLENGYPSEELKPPFIIDGQHYKLTAYFVNPEIICRRGRSTQQYRMHGTGNDLFIQTGPDPEVDLMEIDEHESETTWVKGLCFPKMGFHYFKDLEVNMRCETFFPVATLYYHGRLQGFVWSFGAILNSSYVSYEYPEPEFFLELMEEVPVCLNSLRRSTLHIYFRSNPETFTCQEMTTPSNARKCPVSDGNVSRVNTGILATIAGIYVFIKLI
ncbi:uncharacterized protein LOC128239811 [Mya arenaria]|uniref:uncharacterized protein LOC128239811 n=1 Tax=Mya arenaria TaxID=6604 RepID=UPI0022E2278B|nr:uncharacterized protein LOC128239811 [Mya arenaria]